MDTTTTRIEEPLKLAQQVTPGCFGEQGAKCGPDGPCELHYRVSEAIRMERQRWYDSNKALHLAWDERDKANRYLKLYEASDKLVEGDAAARLATVKGVWNDAIEQAAKRSVHGCGCKPGARCECGLFFEQAEVIAARIRDLKEPVS